MEKQQLEKGSAVYGVFSAFASDRELGESSIRPQYPGVAFNARNIVLAAIPAMVATLTALFSNPRYR